LWLLGPVIATLPLLMLSRATTRRRAPRPAPVPA
jgi:hypothetical protein